ncbi:MAG: glucose-1-phosphate thymidylyltransferase [Chitinophagaceae bacterium]|nr:glucose-1-phosphate thymidylyltransferase [Chitinophagaceae bacterium]
MALVLFDPPDRDRWYPFSRTRAIGACRAGICTMQERWALLTQLPVFLHTHPYLQSRYPLPPVDNTPVYWVDARVIPSPGLVNQVLSLPVGTCLTDAMGLIAGALSVLPQDFVVAKAAGYFQQSISVDAVQRIRYPWELLQYHEALLQQDFQLVTRNRVSAPISQTNRVLGAEQVFLEAGVSMEFVTLNATTGPIYIGKNATVMEGSCIRGSFALGENSLLKLNSRVYGVTSLGPNCMGGGEIKNSIMMGWSNKAHDGYMGDAVIGEWCNWGAGTTNSNVKNNAGTVHMWSVYDDGYLPVGQKAGVLMGDYSRTAIQSAINTGSVIGVACNVFGTGLLPTIINDCSWGVQGIQYEWQKLIPDINNWKKMKGQILSPEEESVLAYIFEHLNRKAANP